MKNKYNVYIGTVTEPIHWKGQTWWERGQGIHQCLMDVETGYLEPVGLTSNVKNPSFVLPSKDGNVLYSVNELQSFEGKESGSVSVFRIKEENYELEQIGQCESHGTDPCYMVLAPGGQVLYVVNFTSGSLAVFGLDEDGRISQCLQLLQHTGSSIITDRQSSAHPHSIVLHPTGNFAVVPDLGADQLFVYAIDGQSRMLSESGKTNVVPGSGPRHGVFHPNGKSFYVTLELTAEIAVYHFDDDSGKMEWIQTVPSDVPDETGINTCADIKIRPDGKYLYASNRGHGSIIVYQVDEETGRLTYVELVPSGGRKPRSIELTPDGRYLLAANQDADNITVFAIDQKDGRLTMRQQVAIPSASGIKFREK